VPSPGRAVRSSDADKAERFHHGQRIDNLIAGYDAVIVHGPPT
jgi:hypothetical protein